VIREKAHAALQGLGPNLRRLERPEERLVMLGGRKEKAVRTTCHREEVKTFHNHWEGGDVTVRTEP